MNIPFISSSGATNAYFMSGKATNEIYIFSIHKMKKMSFMFLSTYKKVTGVWNSEVGSMKSIEKAVD